MRFLHVLTILGALAGGLEMFSLILATNASAPQQAAAAAMAVAWVVIPYCFVRALVEMDGGAQAAQLKRLNEVLSAHTRLLAEVANSASRQNAIPSAETRSEVV